MTYHCTKFRLQTISQTLAMDDFVIHLDLNSAMKGTSYDSQNLGNRCKFNVAVFKIRNHLRKYCTRRDKKCPELG